jgi:hypothetical protein
MVSVLVKGMLQATQEGVETDDWHAQGAKVAGPSVANRVKHAKPLSGRI